MCDNHFVSGEISFGRVTTYTVARHIAVPMEVKIDVLHEHVCSYDTARQVFPMYRISRIG